MRCRLVDIIGLLLMLVCGMAMALTSDRQQPIYIESEEMDVDDLQGVSEYRGAVRFSQGSIILQADRVVVIGQQRGLKKVIAHGQPVHLSQQMDDDQGEMRAVAQKIEYLIKSDSLFLQGDAKLWQHGNEFSGDEIEYHLKKETVVARGDKEQEGRVRIVIQPKDGQVPQSSQTKAGEKLP